MTIIKPKILLVDDEALVLLGFSEEIKSKGYYVRTASSGKEAVRMAKEEKPDIVFTDLVMQEMDGVEVCREIRQLYPETEVVLVSGHPVEIDKRILEFLKAGGKEMYLRKPLLEDELVEAIEKILSDET